MITVILTIWKRKHIKEQIEAFFNQNYPPEEIWIYHCCEYIKPIFKLIKTYSNVRYQYNSKDQGYFGRFSLGLHVKTPYVLIADDDVIPSSDWLSNCIKLCTSYNAIVSSAGRIIPPNDYQPEQIKYQGYLSDYFIGDSDNFSCTNKCLIDTIVDFGCNSWFLKTEWLHYFWSFKPYTFDTGEDIHLSASCNLKAGIKTICPEQKENINNGNLKKLYGFDSYASWRDKDFLSKREKIFRYWIDNNNWMPVKWSRNNVVIKEV